MGISRICMQARAVFTVLLLAVASTESASLLDYEESSIPTPLDSSLLESLSTPKDTFTFASNDTTEVRVIYDLDDDYNGTSFAESPSKQQEYDRPTTAAAPEVYRERVTTVTPVPWSAWMAMLLPLVLGLGVIEATLLHVTILLLSGSYKGRLSRVVPWYPTVATVMALAWAVQMALVAGLLAVCLRMRAMMRDGSVASASHFSAFSVSLDEYTLGPIIFATPVIAFIYWSVLTMAGRIKKAMMSELHIAVITKPET